MKDVPEHVLHRFAATVAHHPERVAIRADDGVLTFAQVDRCARRVAVAMRQAGVRPGEVVGVAAGRSALLPVAFLATWMAGGAYLPLDPAYPAARLGFMLEDARASALVTSAVVEGTAALPTIDLAQAAQVADGVVPGMLTELGDLAYVIYTSGSSGPPKGVEVTHEGVAALVDALERSGVYAAQPAVVAWNASASFDASVQQWVRLIRGDTVVVLSDRQRIDAGQLATRLDEAAVSDLDLTPSHWPHIRHAVLSVVSPQRPLRLFMGGEPIPTTLWRELAGARDRGLTVFNLYGPTECTVDSTMALVEGDEPRIGAPLPGVEVYVLDADLRLAPAGEPGELFIGGRQVARGYRGNAHLTAERFLSVPGVGVRLYRTGDRVRWDGSGLLYLGRIDRQVKVSGYRVEPAEIEDVLAAHPAVSAAVVVVRTDPGGAPVLAAFAVAAPDSRPDEAELRTYCAQRLPAYMVPTAYVMVAALPLTVSGKVDHGALPALPSGPEPEDSLEAAIAALWRELLGAEVGPEDNFFALGGHSLLAIRLVSRVRHQLGIVMSINEVYEHPRLDAFAAAARAPERRQ